MDKDNQYQVGDIVIYYSQRLFTSEQKSNPARISVLLVLETDGYRQRCLSLSTSGPYKKNEIDWFAFDFNLRKACKLKDFTAEEIDILKDAILKEGMYV